MEGGPRVVSRPNQEPQNRHQTPQADHGPDARKSAETDRGPILPAKNRARPYGYSPEVDQTAGGRPVLVVLPIQTDPGAPVQALHQMASPAKGDVGKSGEGHKAREAQVEDGGTVRGREVQRGDPRVPPDYGRGQKGPSGEGRDGEY